MTDKEIEQAVRNLYYKGETKDYDKKGAWKFLTEFAKNVLEELGSVGGKGQMNMGNLNKEQVKNISPALANSPKWHNYVEWFWGKKGFEDYEAIALGFEAATRREPQITDSEKRERDWKFDYNSARKELKQIEAYRESLKNTVDDLYAQGIAAGYGVPVDAGAHG